MNKTITILLPHPPTDENLASAVDAAVEGNFMFGGGGTEFGLTCPPTFNHFECLAAASAFGNILLGITIKVDEEAEDEV